MSWSASRGIPFTNVDRDTEKKRLELECDNRSMESSCNGKEASRETFFEVTFRSLLRAKHSYRHWSPISTIVKISMYREVRSINGLVGGVAHDCLNQWKDPHPRKS